MTNDLLAVLPEILILTVGILVLILDPFWKEENRRVGLGWLTAGGLTAALVISLLFARPVTESLAFGGMVRHDWLGFVFKMLFLFAAAITALFSIDLARLGKRGEFYLLMLASTLGMSLMASASDLIMLYLAIETTSIPLYVLAGFITSDQKSVESGIKYLLFGAMTSAVMLFGFSFLYGFSGSTNLVSIAQGLSVTQVPPFAVATVLVLVWRLRARVLRKG